MRAARYPRGGARREELVVAVLAFALLGWPWFVPIALGVRIGIAVLWYVGAVVVAIMMIRARHRDTGDRLPERERVSRRKMLTVRPEPLPREGVSPT